MPNEVEIKMTMRGFEVTIGGRTARFPHLDEACDFAQQRLRQAQQLRELAARCE